MNLYIYLKEKNHLDWALINEWKWKTRRAFISCLQKVTTSYKTDYFQNVGSMNQWHIQRYSIYDFILWLNLSADFYTFEMDGRSNIHG